MAEREITESEIADGTATGINVGRPGAISVLASSRSSVRPAGTLRREVGVRSPHWAVVIGLVGMLLGGAELLFRSNVLWRVPLEFLLRDVTDRYTRAAWLVHNPPARGADEILLLGSSPAAAVTDLPGNEAEQMARTALAQPDLELVSLTVAGACYAEHLTLLENAFAQGHHPNAVVLFSWPSCLGPSDDTDALLARRMPLVSASLAGVDANQRSAEVRLHALLARVSAVHRYRYTVNAWLRNQWRFLLRGQAPWEAVAFEGRRRTTAWPGDLRLDRVRYERLMAVPARWAEGGRGSRQLAALLDLAKQNHVPVLIIESPWSPPFFEVLADKADNYFRTMQAIATRSGATYVDPNRSRHLSPELFNDLFHVNHVGARAYMPVVASELRGLPHTW